MSADGFLLVHGGFHDRRCWERLAPLLERPVLAVDLPGRGAHPAPMEEVTLEGCVRSVLAELDASGFERAVLVGHSLGGATVPVVAARRPERIAHLVLPSTLLAPDGGAIVDGFLPDTREQAIRRLEEGENARIEMSEAHHREMLNEDMSDEDVEFCMLRHVPESRHLFTDRASRSTPPDDLPRTYIRLRRDLSVSWAQQAHALSLLPGLEIREIDAPHLRDGDASGAGRRDPERDRSALDDLQRRGLGPPAGVGSIELFRHRPRRRLAGHDEVRRAPAAGETLRPLPRAARTLRRGTRGSRARRR